MSITLKTNIEEKSFNNITEVKTYIQENKETLISIDSFVGPAEADMSSLFKNCHNITKFDLTGLTNTSNMTNMSNMFAGCWSVMELLLPEDLDTSNVTDMSWTFAYSKLEETPKNVIQEYLDTYMNVDYAAEITSYTWIFSYYNKEQFIAFMANIFSSEYETLSYASFAKTLNQMEGGLLDTLELPNEFSTMLSSTQAEKMAKDVVGTAEWNSEGEIISGEFGSNIFIYNYSSEAMALRNKLLAAQQKDKANELLLYDNPAKVLEHIKNWANNSGNINFQYRTINTSSVTTMRGMYYGDWVVSQSSTYSREVTTFDTSKVTDMAYMFAYDYLQYIGRDVYKYEWLSQDTKGLDLANFDMSKVTDISYMFEYAFNDQYGAYVVPQSGVHYYVTPRMGTSNPFQTWDLSSVKYMDGMFKECTNLQYGKLSLGFISYNKDFYTNDSGVTYRCASYGESQQAGITFKINVDTAQKVTFTFNNRSTETRYNLGGGKGYYHLNYGPKKELTQYDYHNKEYTVDFNLQAGENILTILWDYSHYLGYSSWLVITPPTGIDMENISGKEGEYTTNIIRPISCKEAFVELASDGNSSYAVVLDLSNLSMENCEDASYMLYDQRINYVACKTGEKFYNWSKMKNASYMFANYRGDTSSPTECDLSSLILGDGKINLDYMFQNEYTYYRNSIYVIIGNAFDNKKLSLSKTFQGVAYAANSEENPTLLDLSKVIFYKDEIDLSYDFAYYAKKDTTNTYTVNLSSIASDKITTFSNIDKDSANMVFIWDPTGKFSKITDLSYYGKGKTLAQMNLGLFSECKLEKINYLFQDYVKTEDDDVFAELKKLNLSNVTEADFLFYESNAICKTNDISCLVMPKIVVNNSMFAGLTFTQQVDFTGIKVTSATGLFAYSSFPANFSLKTLDLSDFTEFWSMFASAKFVDSSPLKGIVTNKITSLGSMLSTTQVEDSNTFILDFANLEWDTSNVTVFSYLLLDSEIAKVDFTGLDFSKAENVTGMCKTEDMMYCNMGSFECDLPLSIDNMFINFDNPESRSWELDNSGTEPSYKGHFDVLSYKPFKLNEQIKVTLDDTLLDTVTIQDISSILGQGTAWGYTTFESIEELQPGDWYIAYYPDGEGDFNFVFAYLTEDEHQSVTISYLERGFVLSENFNFENLTAYTQVGNVQFLELILRSGSVTTVENLYKGKTITYDDIVKELVTNTGFCTLGNNGEIIFPESVKNFTSLFNTAKIKGGKDLVITANGAESVESIFENAEVYGKIKVDAPNATNWKYAYRNAYMHVYGSMTDGGVIEQDVEAGDYYLIADSLRTTMLLTLNSVTIGENTYTWEKWDEQPNFTYQFVKKEGSEVEWITNNVLVENTAATLATTIFKLTLPEPGRITLSYRATGSQSSSFVPIAHLVAYPMLDISNTVFNKENTDIDQFLSNYDRTDWSAFAYLKANNIDFTNTLNFGKIFNYIYTSWSGTTTEYGSRQQYRFITADGWTLPTYYTEMDKFFKQNEYSYNRKDLAYIDLENWNCPELLTINQPFGVTIGTLADAFFKNINAPKLTILTNFLTSGSGMHVIIDNWTTGKLENISCFLQGHTYTQNVEFLNMENFDVSETKNYSSFFSSCRNLSIDNINISWIDTSNATLLDSMFKDSFNCGGTLDLSSWNIEKVTSMLAMFDGIGVDNLIIDNWKFSSYDGYLSHLFANSNQSTQGLLTISMVNTDFCNAETVDYLFYNQKRLTTVTGPIMGDGVKKISYWFAGTSNFTSLDDSLWSSLSNLEEIGYMIEESKCRTVSFTGTYPKLKKFEYAIYTYGYKYAASEKVSNLTFKINAPLLEDASYLFAEAGGLTTIDMSECVFSPTIWTAAFQNCNLLTNVIFPSGITPVTCDYMFAQCVKLTTLDLSDLDFTYTYDMSYMFTTCSLLTGVTFGNTNFQNCEDMSYMFYSTKVATLDFTNWTTPNLYNVAHMAEKGVTTNMIGYHHLLEQIAAASQVKGTCNLQNFLWSTETYIDLSNLSFKTDTQDSFVFMCFEIDKATSISFENTKFEFTGIYDLNTAFYYSTAVLKYYNYKGLEINACSSDVLEDLRGKTKTLTVELDFSNCKLQGYEYTDSTSGEKVRQEIDLSYSFYSMTNLKKITFTDAIIAPVQTYSYYMFQNSTALETIIGLESLDFSNVKYAQYMFEGCTALESIPNFNLIDFSNLQEAACLFQGCSSLKSISFENMDLSQVVSFGYVFQNCTSLKTFSFENTNLSKVTTMPDFFSGCSSLEEAKMAGGDFGSLTSMNRMFYDCTALKSISFDGMNLSKVTTIAEMFKAEDPSGTQELVPMILETASFKGTNFSSLTTMNDLFYNCTSLKSVDFSNTILDKIENTSYMFNNCTSLENIDMSQLHAEQLTNVKGMFNKCSSLGANGLVLNFPNATNVENLLSYCTSLTSFEGSFPKAKNYTWIFLEDTALTDVTLTQVNGQYFTWTFYKCANLKKVKMSGDLTTRSTYIQFQGTCTDCSSLTTFDISELNLVEYQEYAPKFNGTFINCSSLETIDLFSNITFNSGFDQTALAGTFENCSKLKTVKLYKNNYAGWCSGIGSLEKTFKNCAELTELDMSGIRGSFEGANYTSTFEGCAKLITVKLPTITEHSGGTVGSTFENTFKDCTSLTSVELNCKVGQNCTGMFTNCSSLQSVPKFTLSSYITKIYFDSCFSGCTALKNSPAIALTSAITEISTANMFNKCTALTKLGLSWFKWSLVGESTNSTATDMFKDCSNLVTITCNEDSTKVPESATYNMFDGCTSLVGAISYDPEKLTAQYANCTTGYFTLVPVSIFLNGTEYNTVKFNGTEISSCYFNGTKLF